MSEASNKRYCTMSAEEWLKLFDYYTEQAKVFVPDPVRVLDLDTFTKLKALNSDILNRYTIYVYEGHIEQPSVVYKYNSKAGELETW